MQANKTEIQDIIEGTKQYVVPLFQRRYIWEKKHWQVLWDDLWSLYETESPRPHFMGSMVTIPETLSPQGVTKFLLIDGQQRLTTIFIIFCALRDHAKELNDSLLAEEIEYKMLVNKFENGLNYYKLLPTQEDRPAFQKIINQESFSDIREISECYRFFKKQIYKNQVNVRKIKQIICNQLSIVSVVLSADDDPHLVFESLNFKGKSLTQADLIRNYFFMRIDVNDQDLIYKKYWLPMQEKLGDNITEFMRHYLTKRGTVVKQNDVYFEIKEEILQKDVLESLKDVCQFAEFYEKLLNPDLEKDSIIRKYLHRINRLDIAITYPFLMICYFEWTSKRITREVFIEVLKVIENFIIRRFACNIQTQGLNRLFSSLCSRVGTNAMLTSNGFLEELISILQSQNYPKDDKFKDGLMNVKLYGSNRTEKAKIILESIEESFGHKEKVSFDSLSIEHIMPQTLNDWWKSHLGDDFLLDYELLIHNLGNLTLTAVEYNSSNSNSDFETKQKQFLNSHVELNKYFKNVNSWRRTDIEKRSSSLAEIALSVWPYFGKQSTIDSQATRIKNTPPKTLIFLGKEYPVKSWRDVLETTLNTIADLEPDKFKEIIDQFPRFISLNQQNLRDTRRLANGVFIEVNLSSDNIRKFCLKALETAEFSVDDWEVKLI
ncbi:MAG: DUF262 domain-containing HNH endonuclease family protein [Merismopediaceae bacterium]|nr:DUF262 domain-containing HNH endonuclease family protein [Merismopediaceae bacterium]